MYAKEYSNNSSNINPNARVENFDPGPGLNEFARRTENIVNLQRATEAQAKKENEFQEVQSQMSCCQSTAVQDKECSLCKGNSSVTSKKGFLGFEIDDLLLIFIIILLISDGEQDNDILIPIVLAVLLLF